MHALTRNAVNAKEKRGLCFIKSSFAVETNGRFLIGKPLFSEKDQIDGRHTIPFILCQ